MQTAEMARKHFTGKRRGGGGGGGGARANTRENTHVNAKAESYWWKILKMKRPNDKIGTDSR